MPTDTTPKAPKRKRPNHLVSAKRRRLRGLDTDFHAVKLQGAEWTVRADRPLRADVTRSIEEASTISMDFHDPHRRILRSPLLETLVDVEVDGLWFRLANVSSQGNILSLTFEARTVAYLRKYKGPEKAFREQVTRAEFIYALVRKVKEEQIRCWIPELHKERAVKSFQLEHSMDINITDTRGQGLDMDADLTVKGVAANAQQLKLGDIILRAAASHGASQEVMVGLITAAINESTIKNLSYGSESSVGVFQLLSIHGTVEQRMDVGRSVSIFIEDGFTGAGSAEDLAPRMPIQQWLGLVMYDAGGTPYPGLQYVPEAEKWVAAFGGGTGASYTGSASMDRAKRYPFEIESDETYWDGFGRLADDVNFRRFEVCNVFQYVSEEQLGAQGPLIYVTEDTDGIDTVNFQYDTGLPVQEVQVEGRLKAWGAPPGTVAKLNDDYGPAAGLYIVSSITSSLFNDVFSATLKKPMKELPEPAPEVATKTVSFGESGSLTGTGGGGPAGGVQDITIEGTSPGDPEWGGTVYIFRQFVDPFMADHGLQPGARKEQGHTVGGDHDPASLTSYATDYPTTTGEGIAKALAAALGINNYTTNNFNNYVVTIDGRRVRFQILWGAAVDHLDHVHVGARMV